MKTVKRRYFSKRRNEWVEKVYTYTGNGSTRSKTLVGKNGRINKKNVDAFTEAILNNPDYDAAEKRTLIADLNAQVQQRKLESKKMTISGFLGTRANDKISRLFINAGYSVEEAAEEMGISVDELLDEENWEGETFTANDKRFRIQWNNYTGPLWKEV